MVVKEFTLPDVGEGVAEGELVSWLVEPGDRVTEDQPVAEVETDKALVEVPSPYDGTVRELRAEPGDVVPVGDVIITFDVDEEGTVEKGESEGEEGESEGEEGESEGEEGESEGEEGESEGEEGESEGEEGGGMDEESGEVGEASGARGERPVPAPPSVRRLARELGVDLADVDGSGPGGRLTEADVRAAAGGSGGAEPRDVSLDEREAAVERREADDETSPEPRSVSVAGKPSAVRRRGERSAADRDRTLATPATRGLAADLGVDLDEVPTDETRDGTPYVTAEQVRAYAEVADASEAGAGTREATGAEAGEGEPPETETGEAEEAVGTGTEAATAAAVEAATAALAGGEDGERGGESAETAGEPAVAEASERASGERVPYRGVRRAIGEQMERAKFTAPHVTHHDEVEVSRLVETRAALNEAPDVHLTYVPFVLKAVVSGLKEYPYVNARLDPAAEEIVLRDEYNVGVATATDVGLMVPVIEDVDEKGVRELADEVAAKAERARDRSITRSEMQGGTFTVTNVGAIGGEYATPIVNHPEVAILALGAIRERPWVGGGEVVPRHTLPVSLSVDHRVVDGAVAARFTNHVLDRLSRPERLLL